MSPWSAARGGGGYIPGHDLTAEATLDGTQRGPTSQLPVEALRRRVAEVRPPPPLIPQRSLIVHLHDIPPCSLMVTLNHKPCLTLNPNPPLTLAASSLATRFLNDTSSCT